MVKVAAPGVSLSETPSTSFLEDTSQNQLEPTLASAANNTSLASRLSTLRPSRQLLEFYRKKIAEYDDEHADMFDKIASMEHACDNYQKQEGELRNRETEISNLQTALSDLQSYLLEERDHVLRLYAENDRLKINQLDDRRKIAHLLALAGPAAEECSYFLRDPPNHVSGITPIIPAKDNQTQHCDRKSATGDGTVDSGKSVVRTLNGTGRKSKVANKSSSEPAVSNKPIVIRQASGVTVIEPSRAKHEQSGPRPKSAKFGKKTGLGSEKQRNLDDRQILVLQIEALQSRLEEQTRLAKDQIAALKDDKKITREEADAARKRDEIKLGGLTEQLRKTQALLTDATKDFLKLKSEQRSTERAWMAEKDQLCLELDDARDRLAGRHNYNPELRNGPPDTAGVRRSLRAESGKSSKLGQNMANRLSADAQKIRTLEASNQNLRMELEQAVKLSDMYRQQCLKLEEESAHSKEAAEMQRDAFRDKAERLQKRLESHEVKYKSLEKRRATEVEGFKSDIKILRGRLKDMEKQVLKISLGGPVTDLEILKDLHKQTSKSKDMQDQIKNLKNQIYSLETDFRNM